MPGHTQDTAQRSAMRPAIPKVWRLILVSAQKPATNSAFRKPSRPWVSRQKHKSAPQTTSFHEFLTDFEVKTCYINFFDSLLTYHFIVLNVI